MTKYEIEGMVTAPDYGLLNVEADDNSVDLIMVLDRLVGRKVKITIEVIE